MAGNAVWRPWGSRTVQKSLRREAPRRGAGGVNVLLWDCADAGAKEFGKVGAGIEDQGHAGGERIVGQGEPTPAAEAS